MTNSNDMPLAANPIDRAAHHRKDDAWLDTAFKRDDVLVLLLRNGEGWRSGLDGAGNRAGLTGVPAYFPR